MTIVDPTASIARAMSTTRWRGSGLCLDFVDFAMGRPGSKLGNNGGPPNGAWTEAKDGYYYSQHQHPGDEYPPAGVPCYWETGPSGNTAGHIVISLGDGMCRTTDYAGAASVSTQSIASITRARRGGYLGWTEDYGGNPIVGITALAELEPVPVEEPKPLTTALENDMSVPILYADTDRPGILAILEGDTWREIPVSDAGAVMVGVAMKTLRWAFPDRPDEKLYIPVHGNEFVAFAALHGGSQTVQLESVTTNFLEQIKSIIPLQTAA
ncbi:hypothetical protein [Herbiconiux solani]|uniref:hypothetical protein n=1 Tax=Herbiconiux solani TaxID=661329 RepID=UPI0008260698|nr:hypothetical protein [Herbiconiux solani]